MPIPDLFYLPKIYQTVLTIASLGKWPYASALQDMRVATAPVFLSTEKRITSFIYVFPKIHRNNFFFAVISKEKVVIFIQHQNIGFIHVTCICSFVS